MLLCYARVSTIDQTLALQRDALAEAGCGRIFTEQLSGAVTDRPALREAPGRTSGAGSSSRDLGGNGLRARLAPGRDA